MQFLLGEFVVIFFGLISGGFYFRDALDQRPAYKHVGGVFVIALMLTGLFQLYGMAATKFEQLAEYRRQMQVDSENAARAETANNYRELQTELRRLGCYSGPVDGVWGDQSGTALSDFLSAVGRQDEFPDNVNVSDAKTMFAAAPDQICSTANATRQLTALRRYKLAYNSYLKNCREYFLVFPVERKTPDCAASKASRERYARQLEAMGTQPPG